MIQIPGHPAAQEMERLWRQGHRAKDINEALAQTGLDTVNPQTLNRYGQRYWSGVALDESEHIAEARSLIEEAEASGLGTVASVTISKRQAPGWAREAPGEPALSVMNQSSSQVLRLVPHLQTPKLERAIDPTVTLKYTVRKKEPKPEGWEVGVFLPDMQIGYFQDPENLITTHDEAALDVAHQIMADVESMYGIDRVINAGDNLDFPTFGTHRSAPGYLSTLQRGIDRAGVEAATQRSLAPQAKIDWLEGNHECLSSDTLAVTQDGNKRWDELQVDELVLSCDDDQNPVWLPIQAIHSYDYTGEMIEIGSRVGMLATPNHRVVGYEPNNYTKGRLKWKEELAGGFKTTVIPTSTFNSQPDCPLIDDEIRLIGWALTDSHLGERGDWHFYQRESKVQRVFDLLDRLGLSYGYSRRERDITEICGEKLIKKPEPSYDINVHIEDSHLISKVIDSKEFLPDSVWTFSLRQFRLLYEELMYTNGTKPMGGVGPGVLYHSRETRHALQRLFMLNGYSCTLTEYLPSDWRLNVCDKSATRCETSTVRRSHYTGKVWCVTVENGRFFAIRNHHPFLTGNSRLTNYLVDKAPPLLNIRQASGNVALLSVPHLLRFDEYDINYVDPYPNGEIWVNDHLRFEHGSVYSSTPGGTATKQLKNGVSTMFGHCFSGDTEILTRDGWKFHDSLDEGVEVMSYNRDTELMEWNTVSEVFRYTDHKEMISIKSRDMDLMVTPGHGLLTNICPRMGQPWRVHSAEERFGADTHFMLAGVHDETKVDLSDDMIRLLAWIMTDGSITPSSIRISQSNQGDDRIHKLEAVLAGLDLSHSKILRYKAGEVGTDGIYRKHAAYRYNLHMGPWVDVVMEYVDAQKLPKKSMLDMSFDQIEVFLEAWLDGDGSRNQTPNCSSFQTSSMQKEHMDLIQQFCFRTGRRTSLYEYEIKGRNKILYRLSGCKKSLTRVSPHHWSRVEYDGVTWCVTVPNHTLVVRRGKHKHPVVTMNTHRSEWIYQTRDTRKGPRTDFAGSPGCLARLDSKVPSAKAGIGSGGSQSGKRTEAWQQGLAIFWYQPDGSQLLALEPVQIWNGWALYRGKEYRSLVNSDGENLKVAE